MSFNTGTMTIAIPLLDCTAAESLIAESVTRTNNSSAVTAQVRELLTSGMDSLNKTMDEAVLTIRRSLDAFSARKIPRAPVKAQHGRIELLPTSHRVILEDLATLTRAVDTLRRSVILNSLAVVEVLRLHDKSLPGSLTQEMIKVLAAQRWYTSPELACLTRDIIATVTATLPLILQPSAPKCHAMRDPCSICLGELRSAIRLPCSHRYCWNCIVGARSHSHSHCPLCRTEQSLNPREYKLDPVCADVLSDYLNPNNVQALLEDTSDTAGIAFKGYSRAGFSLDEGNSPNTWTRNAATNVLGHAPALHSSPLSSPSLNPLAREFSPSLGFTLPPTATTTSPLRSPLNAAAKSFVPVVSCGDLGPPARTVRPHHDRQMSCKGVVDTTAIPLRPGVGVQTLLEIASHPAPKREPGQFIRYSITELMAMRPLNPNADEFVPYEASWGGEEAGWQDQHQHSQPAEEGVEVGAVPTSHSVTGGAVDELEDGFSVWVNKHSSRHRKAKREVTRRGSGKDAKWGVFRDTRPRNISCA